MMERDEKTPLVVRGDEPGTVYVEDLIEIDEQDAERRARRALGEPEVEGLVLKKAELCPMVEVDPDEIPDGFEDWWLEAEPDELNDARRFWRVEFDTSEAITREPEVAPVRTVQIRLCDHCLDGAGGECHTPGCALWMNRAPDVSLRDRVA